MATAESTSYTDDHLRKAYDILSVEFWDLQAKLSEPFNSRIDQHESIKELMRLGDSMIKVHEARQALNY